MMPFRWSTFLSCASSTTSAEEKIGSSTSRSFRISSGRCAKWKKMCVRVTAVVSLGSVSSYSQTRHRNK